MPCSHADACLRSGQSRTQQRGCSAPSLDASPPPLGSCASLRAQIWFFRGLEASRQGVEFIASLAKSLVIRNYVAKERLPVGQLYILRRGLCVKMWRFLGTKRVWGEDSMIMQLEELIDHAQARARRHAPAPAATQRPRRAPPTQPAAARTPRVAAPARTPLDLTCRLACLGVT
jgi:hypothetical protein